MSVEFRQRSAGDFLQMISRRKWHVILPTLAFFFATLWVVAHLPKEYVSKTKLIIMPPTISEKVAPSLTDADLSQRIQAMRSSVLSRASLEPLIEKYDLYHEDRAAGMSEDYIYGKMIEKIEIETEKAENDRKLLGFTIAYAGPSPAAAQGVTAELADRYVNMQNVESTQSAEVTRQFINEQLAQAKGNLDALEKQRLGIMMQNVETLPESSQGLIAQLQGLRQREDTISKDKESLMTERGRLQDSIRAMNSQGRLIEDFGEKETAEAATQASRIEDTPAYANLIQRRAELNSKLSTLKKQYREKHPDIIATQTEIDKLNDELERLSKSTDARVKQASQTSQRKAELQKKSLDIDKEKAEGQIAQIDGQLQARDAELRTNSGQITALEAKINTIPNVKVALEGVENQYQTAKTNYEELLKKFNNAQQQVQRESNAQGETIQIVDSASLPQKAERASKGPLFVLIGTAVGVGLGLLMAAFFEIPRLVRIQTIDDAAYYTGLPVLASVPPLLTDHEISSHRRTHFLKVLTGAVAAVALVPLLIIVLQTTRILER